MNIELLLYKQLSMSVRSPVLLFLIEALESVMCDVIKIRLKRRIATRSGKGNQTLNIKIAVEWPILKLGLPNFYVELLFYFTSRCT